MEAAIEQLVDTGLAGFTTSEVCRRAGVSQGALFKHFDTKATLLATMIEYLFEVLRIESESALNELDGGPDFRQGIDMLWTRMFDPRVIAVFELYTAARSDAELRAALQPVVKDHSIRVYDFAAATFPDIERERLFAFVDMVFLSVQGLVVNQMALPDQRQIDRLRGLLDELVEFTLR